MTSANYDNLKKFKDTAIGMAEMTDVYLMPAKKRTSLPKYVDRPFHGFATLKDVRVWQKRAVEMH